MVGGFCAAADDVRGEVGFGGRELWARGDVTLNKSMGVGLVAGGDFQPVLEYLSWDVVYVR